MVAHLGPEPSVDSCEFGGEWDDASLAEHAQWSSLAEREPSLKWIDELDKLTMLV
jgi:hypothetical protein